MADSETLDAVFYTTHIGGECWYLLGDDIQRGRVLHWSERDYAGERMPVAVVEDIASGMVRIIAANMVSFQKYKPERKLA